MKEIWKDIKGYEGLYQVSNLGRIKSFHPRYKHTRILKLHKRTNGYTFASLHKNKQLYQPDIHRLVAEAFVENPNPANYNYVLHLDDDITNNIFTNLKWGTQKENCNTERHRKLLSKAMSKKTGVLNNFYGHKHTQKTKDKIRKAHGKKVVCDGLIFNSIKECANYININPVYLRQYLNGTIKTLKNTDKKPYYYEKGMVILD
jgi:hypothetical protein